MTRVRMHELQHGDDVGTAERAARRRNRAILATSAVGVVALGVGWFCAAVTTPADHAVATGPPVPTHITHPVERQQLVDLTTIQGQVGASSSVEVKPASLADDATEPIVTATPASPGAQLSEGDVVIEVALRPMFLIRGAVPSFRGLESGSRGPDVAQLQDGLARLGFEPHDTRGVFGPGTTAAVIAFYRSRGYDAPRPVGAASPNDLADARQRAAESAAAVREAERMLADARRGPSASVLLEADASIAAAERALQLAELAAAETRRESESNAAVAGLHRDRVQADPSAAPHEREDAELELQKAEAAGRLAVAAAAAEVSSASESLDIARSRYHETVQMPDTTSLEEALAAARIAAANTADGLASALSPGVAIPRAAIVFVSSLPVGVAAMPLAVGDLATDQDVALRVGGVVIDSLLPAGAAAGIGDKVRIRSGGDSLTGSVVAVSPTDVTREDGSQGRPLRVVPAEPADQLRVDLPVSVELRRPVTDGAVLVVPLVAVSTNGRSTASVRVIDHRYRTRRVEVETGRSAGGLVEIRAGRLREGQEVVVG